MSKSVVSNPQPCRVLVLGASGAIGRMVQAVWRDTPPKSTVFQYVYRNAPPAGGGIRWHPGEDTAGLPPVDVVVALWGAIPANGGPLEDNPRLGVAAMELAVAVGAGRVLHASSSSIYPEGENLKETGPLAPTNAYGRSKALMEQAVSDWQAANRDGPATVFMRIGNMAGADSVFFNLRTQKRVAMDRFADGKGPRRSYIAPHDLARVIECLCHSDFEGPLNVCAPIATEMEDIVRAGGAEIDWQEAPEAATRVVHQDSSLLQRLCPLPDDAATGRHLVDSARRTGVWP